MATTVLEEKPRAAATDSIARFFGKVRIMLSRAAVAGFLAITLLTDSHLPLWLHFTYDAVGLALTIVAAMGRIWCALYIAGRKNSVLTVDGPYSTSRNPLYFFSFLGMVGLSLFAHLGVVAVAMGALFLVYYHFVIRSEELKLLELFGADYAAYVKKTPRFWPNGRLYHSRQSFSIEPVRMLRALSEVVWFLLAVGLFEFTELLHESGLLKPLFTWSF